MNGRKQDVFIEHNVDEKKLLVWADKGNEDVIAKVPGVEYVVVAGVRYSVYLDPRYDVEIVIAEIKAAILIGKGEDST